MNTFTKIWMTALSQPDEEGNRRGRIYAERSDDKTVYVEVSVHGDDFSQAVGFLWIDIQTAVNMLDRVWRDKEPDAE